jgi:hypothetical protein
MKRVCVVLASGLLFLAVSAVRAEEGNGTPGTLNLAPVPAAPACCAAAPCHAAPACAAGCDGHSNRVWNWLCYKPARVQCACSCHISNCNPPLYTYFLDMCQGGGCGHGACGHAAPCANGSCGAHRACDGACSH